MIRICPIVLVVACSGGSRPTPAVCDTNSGGGVLADHDVPCDPGANAILLTASGEPFALQGYRFPPASDQEVSIVDGWEITFDRVLTTFDRITLANDPDTSPTDQSLTGSAVAELDGPFAIDLHAGGAATGKDGEPTAIVGALTGKNLAGNAAFDSSVRYALSFDVVTATASAENINLDAGALADYQDMVQHGYTTLLVGTATWKGGASCATTIASYDYSKLPEVVHFRLGIAAPASYVNAQNPDNDPAAPFAGEEHQRGIHTLPNRSTVAQLTFHLDHIFWDSFVHDSPAHFDQFAARYAGATTPPTAKLEDFIGFSFTPVVDALGRPLPWRECLGATPPTQGAMTFDTNGVPVDPTGDPTIAMRDFFDYVHHNQSTFGHLNADGLAFVERHYPSPP